MKVNLLLISICLLLGDGCLEKRLEGSKNKTESFFSGTFISLPLGAVKPEGWLKAQLQLQAEGLSGNIEDFWPDLQKSSWKGGDNEAWERGPYYLDGLVPLAYLLDDEKLIKKSQVWIEKLIESSDSTGWYGPAKNRDRWPLAVANKVLMQYYEATQDKRALNVLLNYYRYLHQSPPDWPDSTWRGVRAMENAITGYWLYRQTRASWILEAVEKIHRNSYDWTAYYEKFPWDSAAVATKKIPHSWNAEGLTAHVVNNAMAVKYPGLWYQQSKNIRFKEAVYKAISDYDKHHGQAGGRFSGDEHLSGKCPTQGTELCAVVEYMFSLETLFEILGDNQFADKLELLAYNSLPGTTTPDFWAHQYDQQANQVLVSVAKRNWSTNKDYSNIFGLMPNFACCLANMHQGWPKFVKNMWMATKDNGLAIAAYGPSSVKAKVGVGKEVIILEQTDYPFKGDVKLTVNTAGEVEFPLYLRIPEWCNSASIQFKGKILYGKAGETLRIQEKWSGNDHVFIKFPMQLRSKQRFNNAVSLLYGPLYMSLRLTKEFKPATMNYKNFGNKGFADWEIHPGSYWNYALVIKPENKLPLKYKVTENPTGRFPFADNGDMVWTEEAGAFFAVNEDAPLIIETKAIKAPGWKMKDNSVDDPPPSPLINFDGASEQIQLVPYGCARLRITEFPYTFE